MPKSKHRRSRTGKSIAHPGRARRINTPEPVSIKTYGILSKNLRSPLLEEFSDDNAPHNCFLMVDVCCDQCVAMNGSLIEGSVSAAIADFCSDEFSLEMAQSALEFLKQRNLIEVTDDILSIPHRFLADTDSPS